jgi:hypothetical protein
MANLYSTLARLSLLLLTVLFLSTTPNFARCKRWWVCVYGDGTRVYNHFRCVRDLNNVSKYFNGQSEGGDCDSADYGCGECPIRKVCYPSQADYMKNKHNGIKVIHLEDPPYDPDDFACTDQGRGERRDCED